MFFEESAEKESEILNKILFVVVTVLIGLSDIGTEREHLRERERERERSK